MCDGRQLFDSLERYHFSLFTVLSELIFFECNSLQSEVLEGLERVFCVAQGVCVCRCEVSNRREMARDYLHGCM